MAVLDVGLLTGKDIEIQYEHMLTQTVTNSAVCNGRLWTKPIKHLSMKVSTKDEIQANKILEIQYGMR